MGISIEYLIESITGKKKGTNISYEDLVKVVKKLKECKEYVKEQDKEIELLQKDYLTKMGNRIQYERTIEYIYQVEFEMYPFKRYNLFLIDVDNLHMINRIKGYAEGDKLIKSISNKIFEITDNLPSTYIFRIGGDEFVVISDKKNYSKTKKILDIQNVTATVIEFGKDDNFNEIFNKADRDIIKLKGNKSRNKEMKQCVKAYFKELIFKPFRNIRNIFKKV